MRVAIYSRVSTKDQSVEQQLLELREFCKQNHWQAKEFVDEGISALKKNRPAFLKLMEAVGKKKIDLVLVWKLDRFSRSLKELVTAIDFLAKYDAKFVSYTQPSLDTTTPSGKLMFAIFSAIAEFERDIISERTKLKLKFLKEKGVKLGRPRILNYGEIKKLRVEGLSLNAISEKLFCDKSTIFKALKVINNEVEKTVLKA